jgi:hypothetical protein
LLEVVISIAVFGMFLFILTGLMTEMRVNERRYGINFQRHPQTIAVLSRMRKDVLDAFGPDPYPGSFREDPTPELPDPPTYRQTATTLIITSVQQSGFIQTIVWDFSEPGDARRLAFNVRKRVSNWVAHGVPNLTISTYEIPGRPYSVRLKGLDTRGRLAIDQILQPRAHD